MRWIWNGQGISQVVPSSHEWVVLWYFFVYIHTEKTSVPPAQSPTPGLLGKARHIRSAGIPVIQQSCYMINKNLLHLAILNVQQPFFQAGVSLLGWLLAHLIWCIMWNTVIFLYEWTFIWFCSTKNCKWFFKSLWFILFFSFFSKSTSRKWKRILWTCAELSGWKLRPPGYPQAKHLSGTPPANGRYGWFCSLKQTLRFIWGWREQLCSEGAGLIWKKATVTYHPF